MYSNAWKMYQCYHGREEWASECCLMPSEQIVREQDAFNEMAMMSALN
jgi:hypothetical protein